MEREKFTTTFTSETIKDLNTLKKHMNLRYINDVIEKLAKEKVEEYYNEMETKTRNIK